MTRRSGGGTGGGAATSGGMDFQHRVAAWVAVRILAEQDASPPWDLSVGTSLDWLRCETEQPVDDLLVGTSGGGFIFSQIKHTLQLSIAASSHLASALDQFVRQVIVCRAGSPGVRLWERPLNPLRDRLVLIIGPTSSGPIRVHLPAMLDRLRGLLQGQALEDAAVNEKEHRALSVVVGHVRRSWRAALGVSPSDEEIRQVLSLIHIQPLDVDEGGAAEREANTCLLTTVLRTPEVVDTAWALLIGLCAGFAADRSGADRSGLQRRLLDAGIALVAPRSYREDIERMKAHSLTIAGLLADLAHIRVGTREIKIRRRSTQELRRVAEEGSTLVVGEPGVGKSGALHDLVEVLEDEERDIVFLAAGHLAASSLGELREELGLDRDLTEVLANWPGTQPAFLVIDALDAARADPTARTIRDLIEVVVERRDRWRVVASIRKFDLRYGHDLRHLFSGEPPTDFLDAEFADIRHLNIPRLSDEELAQVSHQSPDLQALVVHAPEELRELLRVPFNLRLMAELLGAGVDPADLTPIRTQLELLNRYWCHRVIRSDGQGDAREAVLSRTCEEMVKTRTLRVNRLRLAEPMASAPLNDLLSTHVLTEWQHSPVAAPDRYVLTFSHHVLFDYSVARLLLRGTHAELVDRLADDPELALVIRPSLLFHFRHLWTVDRGHTQFWDLVLRVMQANGIPEISKLIGPSVVTEVARELSDLEPLCAASESADDATRTAAEQALRHLIGSLLAAPLADRRFVGAGAGPWCDFLERVSRNLRAALAYTVRSLLSTVCEHSETFTDEQRAGAGKTARRLLEFAWTHASRDRWLVIPALESVCRTFESDPAASASLLRRCLEPLHLSEHGFEEMPRLAREVKGLIRSDPALVEEIYGAAFAHRESSNAPTSMGESRILGMISNRQQDYGMALHELAEVFPEFLARAPRRATSVLIAVMEAYVAREHAPVSGEVIERSFEFGEGREACIRTDYSAIWDAGRVHRHDEPLKMLDAFERCLEDLCRDEVRASELGEMVELVISQNRLAVLWRRLLLLGARFPRTLGREILPLAWATPVLTGYDTSTPAGEFLRAVFQELIPPERERVERALLAIPDTVPADRREAGERIRNRLLGCLAEADLGTDEARRLLADLQAADAVPPNEPPGRFEGFTWGAYGEEEYLADEGVPVEAEPNRRIRDLERPVKEFADKHVNSVPTPEEVTTVFPAVEALRTALSHADADAVHPKQRDYAWGYLAAACVRIARTDGLLCEGAAGAFAKTVLLEASHHAEPSHHPEYDAQFDEHPSWGSPAARIEAAEGLIVLGRHPMCTTADVLQAIERLSSDPVPAVRFQIATRLNTLYRTVPDLMWRIVERLCREERSRGVLQGLLSGPLQHLAGAHSDRVASLTREVFDRVNEGPGAREVSELCVDIFTGLYIWRDHVMCHEIVFGIAADPAANAEEANHVLHHLRDPLSHGPIHPSDPNQDAIRRRAVDLITRVLRSARDGLRHIEAAHQGAPFEGWPEGEQESARTLARLIDNVGSQIYFASGAFDGKSQSRANAERPLTQQEKERFYHEVGPILDELSEVGLPSLAHHLLETLEAFIPLDPRGVFLRIGHVVRGGQKGGYQYESLAADLIVSFVERYLAEYRVLLREDEECRRTILEVLDIFVQAGWPSARRLTYRLEEIFR